MHYIDFSGSWYINCIFVGCGTSKLIVWNANTDFSELWYIDYIALLSDLFDDVGPFKINGVPLRRVNQAYVIATSTKVNIFGVNADKFDNKYFSKKADKKKNIKEEAEFFEAERKVKTKLPDEKKDDQKAVDAALIKAIESVPDLKTYLDARFCLQDGMKLHELVF
ncbi:hypothetical protein Droror1_Dr00024411 [Drosera rotundifolia]